MIMHGVAVRRISVRWVETNLFWLYPSMRLSGERITGFGERVDGLVYDDALFFAGRCSTLYAAP
jgi:hypothetical protein